MSKLIKINTADNVLIIRSEIHAGDIEIVAGAPYCFTGKLNVGHKVAGEFIKQGQKIIKYGLSIGSATTDIPAGTHVHLHNMKSDYIPTYTLNNEFSK